MAKFTLIHTLLYGLAVAICQSPTADLGYAQYAGQALENGVSQFLGLRYAKAPLGSLRFAAPEPPENTSGVVEAVNHGARCLASQIPTDDTRLGSSEDCLFADVYTPAFARDASGGYALNKTGLPVDVWIPGGGYTQIYNGNYNGSYPVTSAGNDIIVITFNYRVGPFGFLAGDEVAKGGAVNAGLLDQRRLFQWVQQHVAKFGGDPNHVVIHGTSAGAGSVLHHLTAYEGRNDGLFHAAISDSLFDPFTPECNFYQYQYNDFVDKSGCKGETDTLACLRAASSATLQAANIGYPYPNRSSAALFPYGPCVDGELIANGTLALLNDRKFVQVPLLFGNDNDEGSIFAPNASNANDVVTFFKNNYPLLTLADIQSAKGPSVLQTYSYLQHTNTPEHAQYFALASTSYAESYFVCPSNNVLSAYAAAGSTSIWNYRYAVREAANIADGAGTPHTYQIDAFWGPGDPAYPSDYATANQATIPLYFAYYASFIRTFSPNTQARSGAPNWEPYGSSQDRLLFNNSGAYLETVPADQNARCRLWINDLASRIMQ